MTAANVEILVAMMAGQLQPDLRLHTGCDMQ